MWNMKKSTSIRDLHINTSSLVKEAQKGHVIVIENRGVPVAELRPLPFDFKSKTAKRKFPNREAWIQKQPRVNDSGKILEEIR